VKQGHLIIAAREQDYIQRLSSYMRDVEFGTIWQVTAFTHPPALKQYLKNGYPADLVLAQPVFLEEAGELLPPSAVVAELVRQRVGEGRQQLLQFQPLPELLRQLTQLHREAAGGVTLSAAPSGGPHIVAVYSAAAGIGKTTLALHLARAAALRRKKVFYLNLEQWPGTAGLFGDPPDDSFSRMLYALQAQPDQAAERLREHRKSHPTLHCDVFAPPQSAGERRALTGTVATALLETIASSGEYELIIVDLDSWMDEVYDAVVGASGRLLWLYAEDAVVRGKTQYGLDEARKRGGSELLQRLRLLRIGESELAVPGQTPLETHGILPVVPQWHGPQSAPVPFASPQYRQAVERLLDELIWPVDGAAEVRLGRRDEAWMETAYSPVH